MLLDSVLFRTPDVTQASTSVNVLGIATVKIAVGAPKTTYRLVVRDNDTQQVIYSGTFSS